MGAAHRYWEFPRRLSRIQNPSTVGLISDGQVPHAPTGSAGDDVRRRHAPSSNVLGIAGQNHGVSIEGYDGNVPIDHVACAKGAAASTPMRGLAITASS